jgi:hypothetical protein
MNESSTTVDFLIRFNNVTQYIMSIFIVGNENVLMIVFSRCILFVSFMVLIESLTFISLFINNTQYRGISKEGFI